MKTIKLIVILFALLFVLYSCNANGKKSKKNTLMLNLGSDKKEYNNIVSFDYSPDGRRTMEKTKSVEYNESSKKVIINTKTYFLYDDTRGNLVEKIRVMSVENGGNHLDSMKTLYEYDKDNRLINRSVIDYSGNIQEIEKIIYSSGNDENEVRVRKTLIKKNIPLTLSSNYIIYDTLTTWIEKEYDTNYEKEIRYYKGDEKIHEKTTFYKYYNNGKLDKTYSLDFNNDTIDLKIYKYKNDLINEKTFILMKIGIVKTELFDETGCIYKIVTFDQNMRSSDTSFLKCDETCNVIQMKW